MQQTWQAIAVSDHSILSVRELTERLRKNLETRFPFVWVRGEVTNLSRPGSGHIYFSLKDHDALLQCVWFRSRQGRDQRFDPLTGEVFDEARPSPQDLLHNGLDLLCAGQIGVYAQRGQYQLNVELVQPTGQGLLAQAFEDRKRVLAAAGYFAYERKRPLPPDPKRVALVTSPSGAVLHDFWKLACTRGSGSQIRLFPARVQGEGAAAEIAAAIAQACAQNWAEVLVLIRGGGSLEDLWAFNEELTAKAVFEASVPVLAGIGHEVDVTLADMTADVRAATPSHAAALLWPLRDELHQRVDDAAQNLQRLAQSRLDKACRQLTGFESALRMLSPGRRLARLNADVQRLTLALPRAARHWLGAQERVWEQLERLRRVALRPQQLEARAVALGMRSAALRVGGQNFCEERLRRLNYLDARLAEAVRRGHERRELRLERLDAALVARDPLAPLERGYALVRAADGNVVQSVHEAVLGENIEIRLRDGSIDARVLKSRPRATDARSQVCGEKI